MIAVVVNIVPEMYHSDCTLGEVTLEWAPAMAQSPSLHLHFEGVHHTHSKISTPTLPPLPPPCWFFLFSLFFLLLCSAVDIDLMCFTLIGPTTVFKVDQAWQANYLPTSFKMTVMVRSLPDGHQGKKMLLSFRVNWRQIEVCFSSDVICCGWLGSKYQLAKCPSDNVSHSHKAIAQVCCNQFSMPGSVSAAYVHDRPTWQDIRKLLTGKSSGSSQPQLSQLA